MEHEPHYTYWQIILGRLYEMNVLWHYGYYTYNMNMNLIWNISKLYVYHIDLHVLIIIHGESCAIFRGIIGYGWPNGTASWSQKKMAVFQLPLIFWGCSYHMIF